MPLVGGVGMHARLRTAYHSHSYNDYLCLGFLKWM